MNEKIIIIKKDVHLLNKIYPVTQLRLTFIMHNLFFFYEQFNSFIKLHFYENIIFINMIFPISS